MRVIHRTNNPMMPIEKQSMKILMIGLPKALISPIQFIEVIVTIRH